MNCNSKINVIDLIDQHSLVTREAATLLISKILKHTCCDKIELSFEGVTFISRSFADQFHKAKIDLCENKQIELIVLSENDVYEMLKAVSKTQKEYVRDYQVIPKLSFTNRRSLINYLESL